jgi:hypothetical protein
MFHGPESMLFFRIDFLLHGVMVGWNTVSLRCTFQKDLIHAHRYYDADSSSILDLSAIKSRELGNEYKQS